MRGLIRWAKAVADGDPLEPPPTPDDSARDARLLHQFHLLADIADAHRSFARDSDAQLATTATGPTLATTAPRWPALGARVWGHLELRGLIGRGAFGEVYEAWDRHLERLVALKLLYRDRDASVDAPEITEGRLLARVQHPHVVAVYGADRIDGRVGVWMELIHGRTLEEIVSTTGPLSAQEATTVGLDACRALAAVHQAGLLHRDIKPRNVMRERGGRIVLMDFGAGRGTGDVASDAAGHGTPRPRPALGAGSSGDLVGTPRYLAPEIFDGEDASVRSDLYSLGVLLFYLVTGQTPVGGDSARAVRQEHRVERRVRLREARPDLPDEFIEAVQRALATTPTDRPASAAELAEDLLRASAAGASVAALSAGRPAKKRLRRRRALLAAACIALAGAAGLMSGRLLWPASARTTEARLLIDAPGIAIESIAASPDGRRLAMTGLDASGTSRLWLRALDWLGVRPVAGTEGATGVFWSADGGALGFFANEKLWVVSASGGVPRALASAPNPRGGTWNRAGDIVFAPVSSGPLHRVSANGGAAVADHVGRPQLWRSRAPLADVPAGWVAPALPQARTAPLRHGHVRDDARRRADTADRQLPLERAGDADGPAAVRRRGRSCWRSG